MPTIIDTQKKLSSYTVAMVTFIRGNNNHITSISAYNAEGLVFYNYRNPYGVRHDARANALRTLVLQHSSSFYYYKTVEDNEIYLNNRLQFNKINCYEKH